MPKLPILKAKELVKFLNKQGFYNYHQVGSHAQFKHSSNDRRRTTVPVHPSKDISERNSQSYTKRFGNYGRKIFRIAEQIIHSSTL